VELVSIIPVKNVPLQRVVNRNRPVWAHRY